MTSYEKEVLGKHIVIQFLVNNDGKRRPFLGRITEVKIALQDNGDLETEHLVRFDDGDKVWFDLTREEVANRLTWVNDPCDPTPPKKKQKTEEEAEDNPDARTKQKKEEEEDEVIPEAPTSSNETNEANNSSATSARPFPNAASAAQISPSREEEETEDAPEPRTNQDGNKSPPPTWLWSKSTPVSASMSPKNTNAKVTFARAVTPSATPAAAPAAPARKNSDAPTAAAAAMVASAPVGSSVNARNPSIVRGAHHARRTSGGSALNADPTTKRGPREGQKIPDKNAAVRKKKQYFGSGSGEKRYLGRKSTWTRPPANQKKPIMVPPEQLTEEMIKNEFSAGRLWNHLHMFRDEYGIQTAIPCTAPKRREALLKTFTNWKKQQEHK